jgi:hypothetical protein
LTWGYEMACQVGSAICPLEVAESHWFYPKGTKRSPSMHSAA